MALEKAQFIRMDTGESISVQFNPSSLSVSSSAVISEKKTQQVESGKTFVNKGGVKSKQLRLTLIFDTYKDSLGISNVLGGKQKSVQTIVNNFEYFVNAPAVISFIWGPFMFNGFINNMSTKYQMFAPNGMPVRAVVDIGMDESEDTQEKFSKESLDIADWDIGGISEEEMIKNIMAKLV